MHHRFFAWLFLGALFAAVSLRAQAPAVPAVHGGAEQIKVAKVSGRVTMTVNGAETDLAADMLVPQQAKVKTYLDGKVILAFSNGARTSLEPDSELVIEEFLVDPFAANVSPAQLTEEPSASRTRLALNKGELIGDVKKLRHDRGSSFTVTTPVGAAGIRGTVFRIVFRPNGTGQAFFQLSTVEGNVAFSQGGTGNNNGGGNAGGNNGGGNNGGGNNGGGNGGNDGGNGNNNDAGNTNNNGGGNNTGGNNTGGGTTSQNSTTASGTVTGVAVPTGQEIAITIDVQVNAQGQVVGFTPVAVTGTTNLPPNVAAQVTQVAQDIAVATQQVVFTASTGGSNNNAGGSNNNSGGDSNNGGGNNDSSTNNNGGSNAPAGNNNNSGSSNNSSNNNTITSQISGQNNTGGSFTGTVTTPAPRVTSGDGRPGN